MSYAGENRLPMTFLDKTRVCLLTLWEMTLYISSDSLDQNSNLELPVGFIT